MLNLNKNMHVLFGTAHVILVLRGSVKNNRELMHISYVG